MKNEDLYNRRLWSRRGGDNVWRNILCGCSFEEEFVSGSIVVDLVNFWIAWCSVVLVKFSIFRYIGVISGLLLKINNIHYVKSDKNENLIFLL